MSSMARFLSSLLPSWVSSSYAHHLPAAAHASSVHGLPQQAEESSSRIPIDLLSLLSNHSHVTCSHLNPSLQRKCSCHHWLSPVVPKQVCILESPGDVLKLLRPQPHPKVVKSHSLWGWVTSISCFRSSQVIPCAGRFGSQGLLAWSGFPLGTELGVSSSRVLDQVEGMCPESGLCQQGPRRKGKVLGWVGSHKVTSDTGLEVRVPYFEVCLLYWFCNLGHIFKFMFLHLQSENNHTKFAALLNN